MDVAAWLRKCELNFTNPGDGSLSVGKGIFTPFGKAARSAIASRTATRLAPGSGLISRPARPTPSATTGTPRPPYAR